MARAYHSTNSFYHRAEERKFTAWASDLQPALFGYDKALTLVSEKTGRNSDWAVTATHRDEENDVTHWDLQPTEETLRNLPALRGYRMVIYND